MLLRFVLLGIVLVSLQILGSENVSAREKNTYSPGMLCQPATRPSAIRNGTIGEIVNSSTTAGHSVLCPIVVNSDTDIGEISISYLNVYSNSSGLICTVYSRTAYGERIVSAKFDKVTSDGPGHWNNSMYWRNLSIKYGPGYYYIDCALPPGSSLFSYSYYQY